MLPNPLVPEVAAPKVEPAASSELKTLLDAFRDLAHTAKAPDHIGRAHWAFSACFLLGTWLPNIVA